MTDELATEINKLHLAQNVTAKEALETAIKIGGLLDQQHQKTKHGEWLTWLQANIKFERKTADRYQKIYKSKEKLVTVTNLSEAYRIVIPKAPKKTNRSESIGISKLELQHGH